MHSKNFTKGKNPRIIQGEVFTDKDIPPFMSMKEWNKKHGLGEKKWIQEQSKKYVDMRAKYLMEQDNMINVKGFTQPNWEETPFENPQAMRDYYTSKVDPDYDWKNITHWGPQHQKAFDDAITQKSSEIDFEIPSPEPFAQDFGMKGTGVGSILQPDPEHHLELYDIPKLAVSDINPGFQAAIPSTTLTPGIEIPIDQDYIESPSLKKMSNYREIPFDDLYGFDDISGEFFKQSQPYRNVDKEGNLKTESTKTKRITEIRKHIKRRITEMVEDELQDNQLGNGRMISGEPKDIKYKEGMQVQDINPDCPHRDSRGVVVKVSNGSITYKVTNWGRHFQPGDELTKSADQLIPLSSEDKPWYLAGE